MRLKHIGALLTAALVFFACDDTTNTLGMGMLPDSDGMSAHTITFDVTTHSYLADAVYAKTSTGYVGRFTDPEFGAYTSSFLTELNCTDNFKFSETLPPLYEEYYSGDTLKGKGTRVDENVAGLKLILYYSSWFGDSLNACRMSAYELNDRWIQERQDGTKHYRYTDINPQDYYDETGLLGRKAYSAYDTTVPDSVRNATDSSGNPTYSPSIVFNLPTKEFGEDRILKPYRDPATRHYFDNPESFIENVFKGVYQMRLHLYYVNDSTGVKLKKQDGTDSTYYSTNTLFASTKEVTQVNHFLNSEKLSERINEKGWTYLKSPAGIFTQATLPYDEIYAQLANDTLNGARLTFTNYRQGRSAAHPQTGIRQVLRGQ